MNSQRITQAIDFITSIQLDKQNKEQLRKELKGIFSDVDLRFDDADFKKQLQPLVNALNTALLNAGKGINFADILQMDGKDAWHHLGKVAATDFIDAFNASFKGFNVGQLDDILKQVTKIADKVTQSTDKMAQKSTRDIAEIDAAIARLGKNSKKFSEEALNFTGGKRKDTLSKTLATMYVDLNKLNQSGALDQSEIWEKNAAAIVKYGQAFEQYRDKFGAKIKLDGTEDELNAFKNYSKLFEQLIPRYIEAKNSLQSIINRGAGSTPAGFGDSGTSQSQSVNGDWAKETTLQEVLGVLKGGLKVSSDNNSTKGTTGGNKTTSQDKQQDTNPQKIIASQLKTVLAEIITSTKARVGESWDRFAPNAKGDALYQDFQERIGLSNEMSKDQIEDFKTVFTMSAQDLLPLSDTVNQILSLVATIDNVDIKQIGRGVQSTKTTTTLKEASVQDDGKIQAILSQLEILKDALNLSTQEFQELTSIVQALQQQMSQLTNSQILQLVDTLSGVKGKEAGTFLNSKTGAFAPVVEGDKHETITDIKDWKAASENYDTRIHKHNFNTAVPSVADFEVWAKGFKYIQKEAILANKELLLFDFSSFSEKTIQEIGLLYSTASQRVHKEFDGYKKNGQIGEKFGTIDAYNEALQMALRAELDKIMQSFPGIMKSYAVPNVFSGVAYGNTDQVKAEAQAHQENADAKNADAQAQERLNIENTDGDGSLKIEKENALLQQQKELLGQILVLQSKEGLLTLTKGQNADYYQQKIDEINRLAAAQEAYQLLGGKTPEGGFKYSLQQLEDAVVKFAGARQTAQDMDRLQSQLNNTNRTGTKPQGGVISGEAGDLESIRKKVAEVTAAVKTKNEAFLAEQKVVKKAAQSEIHSLGEIEKKVTSVKAAIANIHTQSKAMYTPEANTEAFTQEGQVAEGVVSQEMSVLTKLRAALQLTTKRINEKTQAFEAEKSVVNSVVNSEINALNRLNTHVDTVNKTVMTLLQNLQNVQTGVPNIPTPQAQPTPQNNTGAQGQGTGSGGGGTSPKLLNAKIDTQFSSLSLMYAQLESVGKLTPQIEQQWLQLWDSLSKVNDGESLKLWREELTQVHNSMKEIMIANDLVEKEGVQSFNQLINATKLYNQMMIGATRGKTPEERGAFQQEANTALVEQQRILQGITLTKEQQAQFDELEIERIRQINIIQAQQTGRQKQIHDAQIEAEIIKRLVQLYEQLGRAQFLGNAQDAANIRQEIGAERANLSSVDYATDMKFFHAKEKGYNSEQTKAENVVLKEQKQIISELNTLYKEYGILVERASATQGTNFGDQVTDEMIAKATEIQTLLASLKDPVTPEMQQKFTEAFDKGKAIESTKQYEAIAKKADQDEIARLNNIKKLEAEIGKLRAQVDSESNTGVKKALEQEIQLRKDLIALQEKGLAMDAQDEAYYRQMYSDNTGRAKSDAKRAQKEQQQVWNDAIKNARKQAGVGKAESVESRAIDTWAQASVFPGITPEVQNSLNEYQSKIQVLRSEINNFPSDRIATDAEKNRLIQARLEVDAYTKEIQELIAQYERLSGPNAQATGINMSSVLGTDPKNMEAELTKQVQALTKGRAHIKGYNAETQQLIYTQKAAGGGTTQFTAEINRLNGQLTLVQGTTTKAMGVFDTIIAKTKQFSYYFTGSMMIYRVIGWVREGVTAVKELDSAMTELKKVTDETEETYDKFLDTASEIGSRVGSTMKDVVSSTADWARLNI